MVRFLAQATISRKGAETQRIITFDSTQLAFPLTAIRLKLMNHEETEIGSVEIFPERMSFDGFGCCRISDSTRTMSIEDSTRLIGWLESDDLSNDAVTAILTQYFEANSDIIWRDALVTHGLLESDTDHDPKG